MPKKIVLDASVVLKWFSPEPAAELALQIYKSIKTHKLIAVAPIFLLVETMNILIRKKQVAPNLVRKALAKVSTCGIVFTDISPAKMDELQQIVSNYKVSAYDGLYLWLAQQEECKLLTVDRELLKLSQITIGLEALTTIFENN